MRRFAGISLHIALVAALSEHINIDQLDASSLWRETAPQPLT